jgi:hypothetical protein
MRLVAIPWQIPGHTSLSGQTPGIGLRLRVRFRSWRLDRELADGCALDASEDRALRARQLAQPATRQQLACSLRRVVANAEDPRVALSSTVPVLRQAVLPCSEALLGLAVRLEQPDPVNPCGIARALLLLTDGTGPLYSREPKRPMGETIWWIVDGLQPCAPHDRVR